MIPAGKVINIKVVQLIKIYNSYFGHLFIRQSDSNIVHKFYISLSNFHKLRQRCRNCEQRHYNFVGFVNHQNKKVRSW